jgi:dTDP-4-amino-4,6-dideoxygalactose transaminase
MIKYIQEKYIDYIELKNILKHTEQTNQFTNLGPAKRMLEKKLEQLLRIDDTKSVVCTANGTLALHAIYLYFKNKNIRWVSPSFTFPSCVVGGFNCELVDIDHTYTMSLSEDNFSKYEGFIITNLFGTYPHNIGDWIDKCKKHRKILVFDNASSSLTNFQDTNICNLGDFSFGSLHHTKSIGFGEGGFLVCDKSLYSEFNRICGFGFKYEEGERKFGVNSSNFKMSDITAGCILQHINRYSVKKHEEIQEYFLHNIERIEGVEVFNYKKGVFLGNLPVLFEKNANKKFFIDRGIEAQKYYKPIKNTKNSNDLFCKIINFPLHTDVSIEDANQIIKAIKEYSRSTV